MAHTFTNLLTHIVFSTSGRRDLIADEIRNDLHAYMGGVIRNLKGTALAINGTKNHVHALIVVPADKSVSELVRTVKSNSTKWVHEKWPIRKSFAWQTGYSAFAVSDSNKDKVLGYIARQEEHHRRVTFEEEFVAFLKKQNIDYDPRFVME